MGLRARFVLWFCLVATVPIAAAAVVTRDVLSTHYRRQHAEIGSAARRAVQRQVDQLKSEVDAAVAALAREDHPDVGGILSELEKGAGRVPDPYVRELRLRDRGLMRANGLDLLYLVAGNGEILSSPHYRARQDEIDQSWLALAGKGVHFAREAFLSEGRIVDRLVARSVRRAEYAGYAVAVAGARIVDGAILSDARLPPRQDARVVSRNGEVWVAPADLWQAESAVDGQVDLVAIDGSPIASVELAVSDREFVGLARQITRTTLLLALAALVATVGLAMIVARGMTRDLDELVSGAQAVSAGDFTHRVRVRRRNEIGKLALSFNAMVDSLRQTTERLQVAQRIAAWQEIARRIAHEIKNPLTPIQMSVETMRKTRERDHPSFPEVFEESTATILEEVDRLKRIVTEFSEFARMPKPSKTSFDVNELIRSTLALYAGSMSVDSDLAENLPVIEADKDQLSQVLLNLLENARDAVASRSDLDRPPMVRLSTAADHLAVIIRVEDSGPGVARDARERLFTPYFTTKAAGKGTGLGLAIAHRIATDHGGSIEVGESELGGASFTLRVPAQST